MGDKDAPTSTGTGTGVTSALSKVVRSLTGDLEGTSMGTASAELGLTAQLVRENRKLKALTSPQDYIRERTSAFADMVARPVDASYESYKEALLSQGLGKHVAKKVALGMAQRDLASKQALFEMEFPAAIEGLAATRVLRQNFLDAGAIGAGGYQRRRKSARSSRRRSKK